MNANRKLMQFIASVDSNVESEAQQLLSAARAEAEQITQNAARESNALSQRQLTTAKKALALKYQRRLAQNSFQFHTAILQRRARHLSQLFADLEKRIAEFAASESYLPWLKNLLTTLQPEENTTILLREADLQYADILAAICHKSCCFSADASIVLGGCTLLSPDGKRCRNHTLDDALGEQIRHFHREQLENGGNQS
ncbi:MAG: hypothetical protein IJC75_04130 [Oscillospiraceae bacterium]|nr:hypothetical protein [Oscillospiraceae bacterium]